MRNDTMPVTASIPAGRAGGAAVELHISLAKAGVKWKMGCETAYHSPSFEAPDELTMARIAAFSGGESFVHALTTWDRP
jgi:hypothetical protein